MLEGVVSKYKIDADRVYVIGASMGGFGTWDLISRHPNLFAAGLPNAGGGPPDAAAALRNMAIWSHHNDGDTAVPVFSDREMFKAIAVAGGRPLYTETVSNDHSDVGVVGDQNFLSWMLAQRRGVPETSNKRLAFDPPGGAGRPSKLPQHLPRRHAPGLTQHRPPRANPHDELIGLYGLMDHSRLLAVLDTIGSM